MTVKYFSDKTEMNVYFHMKNHYKKIKNVKSTIDNSTPQGFIKAVSTPPNSERSWKTCTFEDSHIRKCSQTLGHNALKQRSTTKSDTLIRSFTLPPRPATRRRLHEMPYKLQCKSRSQSMVPTNRREGPVRFNATKKKGKASIQKNHIRIASPVQKDVNVMFVNQNIAQNVDTTESSRSELKKPASENGESVNKSRLEEHEYLHFLLKITEDIILNNFYTNEDIGKVFQCHMEANKDRLKLEKMEAQLARLCVELNIPYKFSVNVFDSKECYQNFFENHSLIPEQHNLTDCECTTIRALEINNKQVRIDKAVESGELNNIFELENRIQSSLLNILSNKCSLGRVSECTEPTNSVETLVNETTRPSLVTVSSFGNIDILPCFENMENTDQDARAVGNQEDQCEESLTTQLFTKDPQLTIKEKYGCFQEEILFHKWKYGANERHQLNDFHNSVSILNLGNEPSIENISPKDEEGETLGNKNLKEAPDITNIQDNSLETNVLNSIEDPVQYLGNVDNYLNKDRTNDATEYDNENTHVKENVLETKEVDVTEIEQTFNMHGSSQIRNEEADVIKIEATLDIRDCVQNVSEGNCTKPVTDVQANIQIDKPISEIKEEIQIACPNSPNDKNTPITNSSHDKECTTGQKLTDYSKDDDYILINGPVYILKTVLNSKDKLILYDKPTPMKNGSFEEISPEKLCAESTIPFNCFDPTSVIKPISEFDYVSFYMRKNNSTKLLQSDYDLTPQRDCNTSDKYHHLLVDATTSISNMRLTELMDKTVSQDTLLLTDQYTLNDQNEHENMVQPERKAIAEDHSKQNGYVFSNDISVDGQYEIKSYSLPKEVNGSVLVSHYCAGSQAGKTIQGGDEEMEIGIPLDGYEINTEIATVAKEENEKVSVTTGSSKIDFSLESNVSTDTEISQSRSVRSEGERHSSSLCLNRKHILGKRKLEHPP